MKKLLIVLAVLAMATPTMAQTWHTANQVTVGWDAVPKIVAADTIKYQIYYRTDLVSLGTKLGGEVTETQATVTLPNEGKFWLGAETVRYIAGETDPVRSERKAWSNAAEDCGPAGPFGVKYFIVPNWPVGLKFQP
jgi:hypothetical protein